MKRKRRLTPNQAIIIMGTFLGVGGLISLSLNYINKDEVSSVISSIFLLLMGIIMVFLGRRTKI